MWIRLIIILFYFPLLWDFYNEHMSFNRTKENKNTERIQKFDLKNSYLLVIQKENKIKKEENSNV